MLVQRFPVPEILKDHNGIQLGILVRQQPQDDTKLGINFVTHGNDSLQVATMFHPRGKEVDVHYHPKTQRVIQDTNEVLILVSGVMEVIMFTDPNFKSGYVMHPGDLLIIQKGWHGVKMITDCEIIEVKQGPHVGEADKIRFNKDIHGPIPTA